jgi:hypothetical protein
MKRALFLFCLVVSVSGLSFAADSATDPVEGYWFSLDDRSGEVISGWEFYCDSGGVLYGRLLSGVGVTEDTIAARCRETYANFPIAGKVNQMPVLGTPWFFGFRNQDSGRWTGGTVVNAETGKVYSSTLTYHAIDDSRYKVETLEVRGYVFLFSGAQYWRRCTEEEALSLR